MTQTTETPTKDLESVQKVFSIIYPVKDLENATKVFSKTLGSKPAQESSYYVGFNINGLQVGLDPNGHTNGMTGPIPYYNVSDIKTKIQTLVDAGCTVQQEVKDVGYGNLMASVKDKDGNIIGFMQSNS